MKKHTVLLYYCYTPIAKLEEFREEHHLFCLSLNLLGRIIVAPEGLNGTVSGTAESCLIYMDTLKADPQFSAIDFKIDLSDNPVFLKMRVRVKPEIVHVGLHHIDPNKRTGLHLEP